MAFNPVTITLTVKDGTKTVDSPPVTRTDGPEPFSLHLASLPDRVNPFDPNPPGQPFTCTSVLVDGRETGRLQFDLSKLSQWEDGWFRVGRSVKLSMNVEDKGETLLVRFLRVEVSASPVKEALHKVADTGSAFVSAIAVFLKVAVARFLSLFARRRDKEPEFLPADGPHNLE